MPGEAEGCRAKRKSVDPVDLSSLGAYNTGNKGEKDMRYGPQCTHTRRNFHRFDKEAHRCPCGRWERGFAPKKEEKQKFECQICCRHQCVSKTGTLVLHGYERPGHGWITGSCFGTHYLPYPDTAGLVKYLVFLESHKTTLETRLAKLPTEKSFDYTYGRGEITRS